MHFTNVVITARGLHHTFQVHFIVVAVESCTMSFVYSEEYVVVGSHLGGVEPNNSHFVLICLGFFDSSQLLCCIVFQHNIM